MISTGIDESRIAHFSALTGPPRLGALCQKCRVTGVAQPYLARQQELHSTRSFATGATQEEPRHLNLDNESATSNRRRMMVWGIGPEIVDRIAREATAVRAG
jgi:hypothetical protein